MISISVVQPVRELLVQGSVHRHERPAPGLPLQHLLLLPGKLQGNIWGEQSLAKPPCRRLSDMVIVLSVIVIVSIVSIITLHSEIIVLGRVSKEERAARASRTKKNRNPGT